MAARKTRPEGRPKGAKTKPREPLLQMSERGVVTAEHCELARRLALIGLDDQRIATALGISESTLTVWKRKFPEFKAAIHAGKDVADAPVIASLYELAQRRIVRRTRPMVVDKSVEIVEYDEVVEADVKAAQYLMACRHPEKWSLNKLRGGGDSESADEIARQEAAVRQMLEDVEARSVVALLGLTPSSKAAR
jgi:transposase-like protein